MSATLNDGGDHLYDARTAVIAAADTLIRSLRIYLDRHVGAWGFDHDARTLMAVVATYRGLLDSQND